MNAPTNEQLATWFNATLGLTSQKAAKIVSTLAYQAGDCDGYDRGYESGKEAGRAAALEELRAGGVEVPEWCEQRSYADVNTFEARISIKDYGDGGSGGGSGGGDGYGSG